MSDPTPPPIVVSPIPDPDPAARASRPDWLSGATLVWSEDDANVPDRERIDGAWRSITGKPLHGLACMAEWAAGDAVYHRMPGGWIACTGCDGGAIYRERDCP